MDGAVRSPRRELPRGDGSGGLSLGRGGRSGSHRGGGDAGDEVDGGSLCVVVEPVGAYAVEDVTELEDRFRLVFSRAVPSVPREITMEFTGYRHAPIADAAV